MSVLFVIPGKRSLRSEESGRAANAACPKRAQHAEVSRSSLRNNRALGSLPHRFPSNETISERSTP